MSEETNLTEIRLSQNVHVLAHWMINNVHQIQKAPAHLAATVFWGSLPLFTPPVQPYYYNSLLFFSLSVVYFHLELKSSKFYLLFLASLAVDFFGIGAFFQK